MSADSHARTRTLPGLGDIVFDGRSRLEIDFLVRELIDDGDYFVHGVTLEPGAMVVDAGAHIGLFALLAHQQTKGDLHLLCFEPATRTRAYLEQNLGARGLIESGRAKIRAEGLTHLGGPDSAELYFLPGMPANSSFAHEAKKAELERFTEATVASLSGGHPLAGTVARNVLTGLKKAEIETCALIPLSRALAEEKVQQVDLLKIDVEHFELDVLAGIEDRHWPMIRQIVVEVHGAERAEELAEICRNRGFTKLIVDRPPWAEALDLENHRVVARR
jgi:FkbM family methyltransferase